MKLAVKTLALAAVCAVLSFSAQAMSVSEAYRAIPVQQTAFDPARSRLPSADAIYLQQLFAVTDLAMRDRVAVLQRLYHGQGGISPEEYAGRQRRILSDLQYIRPPAGAEAAHAMIVQAVSEQGQFVAHWAALQGPAAADMKATYGRHALVQSSHTRLLAAYGKLMGIYAAEDAQNKQSFYSHLCALDFI